MDFVEILFRGFFLFYLASWVIIRSPYHKKYSKTEKKTKKRNLLEILNFSINLIGMMIVPIISCFFGPLFVNCKIPIFLRIISSFFLLFSLFLFIWSHQSLGDNFSPLVETKVEHKLIIKGPYKYVRHPMYTFFWIMVIFDGILLSDVVCFLISTLLWGFGYFFRISSEEDMLLEEFGEEYKIYMKKVPYRIIPYCI